MNDEKDYSYRKGLQLSNHLTRTAQQNNIIPMCYVVEFDLYLVTFKPNYACLFYLLASTFYL